MFPRTYLTGLWTSGNKDSLTHIQTTALVGLLQLSEIMPAWCTLNLPKWGTWEPTEWPPGVIDLPHRTVHLNLFLWHTFTHNTKSSHKIYKYLKFISPLSSLLHMDHGDILWNEGGYGSQGTSNNKGVCHTVALPFTLKSILRQKKNDGNSNISPSKNYNLQKNSSKRNQNPSSNYNSITNLKFQHKPKYHHSKILIYK